MYSNVALTANERIFGASQNVVVVLITLVLKNQNAVNRIVLPAQAPYIVKPFNWTALEIRTAH